MKRSLIALVVLLMASACRAGCVPFADSWASQLNGAMNPMATIGGPWLLQGPNSKVGVLNGLLEGGCPTMPNNVFYASPAAPLQTTLQQTSAVFQFVADDPNGTGGDGAILLAAGNAPAFQWGHGASMVHLVIARHFASLTWYDATGVHVPVTCQATEPITGAMVTFNPAFALNTLYSASISEVPGQLTIALPDGKYMVCTDPAMLAVWGSLPIWEEFYQQGVRNHGVYQSVSTMGVGGPACGG